MLMAFAGWVVYFGLGGSVGLHRLMTHRSFETHIIIERILCIFAIAGNLGSPARWVAVHLLHHGNADTDLDPHPPHKTGFFGQYPLVTGTQTTKYDKDIDYKTKRVLAAGYGRTIKDPFQKFIDKYYYLILVAWSAGTFALLGLEGLVFFHAFAMVLTITSVAVANFFGHYEMIGTYKPHETKDKSVNNRLFSLVTFGETIHNNHHKYPKKWNYSESFWELDPGSWVIRLIKK